MMGTFKMKAMVICVVLVQSTIECNTAVTDKDNPNGSRSVGGVSFSFASKSDAALPLDGNFDPINDDILNYLLPATNSNSRNPLGNPLDLSRNPSGNPLDQSRNRFGNPSVLGR